MFLFKKNAKSRFLDFEKKRKNVLSNNDQNLHVNPGYRKS